MDDYISKPVHIEELVAALERSALPATSLAPPPISTCAIDISVLEEMQASLGEGDSTIVVEVIDIVLADLPLQIEALRQSVDAGATEMIQRIAHTIKGSAATVGAHTLADRCKIVESLARSGDLGGASAASAVITPACAEALAELAALRHRFAPELAHSDGPA